MAVGVPQGIHAAAILLLVKVLALADFDHAGGAAAFAPVIGPVDEFGIAGGGPLAAAVDLVHVLPARNAQRAGDGVETMFVSIQRGAFEAHVEADRAAFAALRFVFETPDALEPVVAIVVGVDEFDAVLFGESDVLVLADL